MNPRLTTILTLSGVLVAGTAAAAVNSSILSNRSPLSQQSPAAGTVTSVAPTVDDSTGESVIYQIGDAGEVTVLTDSSSLEIESVTPADGWTVAASDESGGRVQVQLANPTMTVTFTASLVRGVVVTSIESAAAETTSTSTDMIIDDSSSSDDQGSDDYQEHNQTNTTVRHRSTSTTEHREHEDHEDHEAEDHSGESNDD